MVLGWCEWAALLKFGIDRIKCKMDTGARTSALHAYFVDSFESDGRRRLRIGLHLLQKRNDVKCTCVTVLLDERIVTDSGGNRERIVSYARVWSGQGRAVRHP